MQRKFLTLGLMFFLLSNVNLFAQTTSISDNDNSSENIVSESKQNLEDWSFFLDEENKVYYIDFEMINVNLNDVIVKDASGEVVWKDQVWDLPVNTIYELDVSNYKSGNYFIELRTFTGTIKKDIQVK